MDNNRVGFWRQFYNRNCRLLLTLVSKQWLVFFIGTGLLIRQLVTAEVWLILAGIVIGVNVAQKHLGLDPTVNAGKEPS